jgi:hypothetical protein
MRKLATSRVLLSSLAVSWIAGSACAARNKQDRADEFESLGTRDNNSELPPGLYHPIGPGDLTAVQVRGRLLFEMERGLALGYEHGVFEVGLPPGDVALPLVDIDPGGGSGQVVFLRWPQAAVQAGGELRLEDAERWLMVPIMLGPDRALEPELLHGPVVAGTDEHVRAEAILQAARVLREQASGEMFHLFTVYEVLAPDKPGKPTKIGTRVYAMSAEGEGPDLEILIDQPRRKKVPPVLATLVVHPSSTLGDDRIELTLAQPAPATVARVMLRGSGSGDVQVQTSTGTWQVSGDSGRVVRGGG